jgi:hypothetical protein
LQIEFTKCLVQLKPNDIFGVTDLSRLGRHLLDIFLVSIQLMEKKIFFISLKEKMNSFGQRKNFKNTKLKKRLWFRGRSTQKKSINQIKNFRQLQKECSFEAIFFLLFYLNSSQIDPFPHKLNLPLNFFLLLYVYIFASLF